VAREAFRKLASGELSARRVTVWLAGLPGLPRRVYHSSVQVMLKTPTYMGRFADGSPGRWEPLIDGATWDAAQARLVGRPRGPVSGRHLLTGVLRCDRCGGRMSGWTTRKTWKRYRCGSFGEGGERAARNCSATLPAKTIDADVIRQVADLLALLATSDSTLRTAISRAWDRLRQPDDAAAKERARLLARAKRDAEDARRRIADAARLLVDGVLDRAGYQALADAEQRRLESAERTLASPDLAPAPTTALPPWQTVANDLGGWEQVLAGDVVPEQRRVLALVVERVVPRKVGYGRYEADVAWTATGLALRDLAGQDAP
jgi:hypothetical protein